MTRRLAATRRGARSRQFRLDGYEPHVPRFGVQLVLFAATGNSSLAAVPPVFWLWTGVAVLLTGGIGFAVGYFYGKTSVKLACQRAKKHMSKLFQLVVETLETAEDACGTLEKFPGLALSADQTNQLASRRSRLLETVSRIVETQCQADPLQAESEKEKIDVDFENIDWERSPEDKTSGLPNRKAFEANLDELLSLCEQSLETSGLLLIKIDRYSHLQERVGQDGAAALLKKFVGIVCRAIRDQDLVCHYSVDTFAVLYPGIDGASGKQLADTLRSSVRHHHFRIDAGGPEVLVTASFGYTTCLPHDNHDLVVNRAGNALSKSQSRGRNQLHVHDGEALVHCSAS